MNCILTLRCDGRREYVERTVASVNEHIAMPFEHRIIVDDSGDLTYATWLDATFPDFECIHHASRLGLGGCFQSMLEVATGTDADYLFAVEDDTPIIGHIALQDMATVLDANESISQLMLQRPAFNAAEIAAGGVYQLTPDLFTEQTQGTHQFVTHEKWFGFQPFLCKRSVADFILANANNFLELGVTEPLKMAGYKFGYWGGLNDAPLCEHAGTTRSSGYRW